PTAPSDGDARAGPPSARPSGERLDLDRARGPATLADVLVLLAVEEHQEEPLPYGHRLAALRAVQQARLERPVRLGLSAARRAPLQGGMAPPAAEQPHRIPPAVAGPPAGRYVPCPRAPPCRPSTSRPTAAR